MRLGGPGWLNKCQNSFQEIDSSLLEQWKIQKTEAKIDKLK